MKRCTLVQGQLKRDQGSRLSANRIRVDRRLTAVERFSQGNLLFRQNYPWTPEKLVNEVPTGIRSFAEGTDRPRRGPTLFIASVCRSHDLLDRPEARY